MDRGILYRHARQAETQSREMKLLEREAARSLNKERLGEEERERESNLVNTRFIATFCIHCNIGM